ncbi:SDR family oxidoreductase [Pseudomaricurvus alkylphenolicus]|uniref:SDR family NAD(P)-dependent oxidoreductase n=1 Tax=Pseudomaricurvus alkylphenolicus TaxID=1306991 RepID=UPI0014202B72|nr:SDR family oxidoreductase [Pseudomaricurvus alkylphenolicus]NIB44109.1 SDR family oxidoreductase [Pseudomaricurvus alkylphenolicus]
MRLLENKVAVVTGAGGGIGRGVARRFAREGAAVVVAEIDEKSGRKTAKELEQLGGRGVFVHTDVTSKDSVEAAVRSAVECFGGLDILINNAFVPTPNVLLEDKTDEMLEQTLTSTIKASWWAMRAALPLFRLRGGGKIVNFFSIDVDIGAWLHADYNTAKAGIVGLTRSAAAEWGRFNITVNAVAPTAMGATFHKLAADNPGFAEKSAAMRPMGRCGDPEEDVAPAVVFLASDLSRYVTGETLHVDGGLHLPGYNSRPEGIPIVDVSQSRSKST